MSEIVSVRMPSRLVQTLKAISNEGHYLDLSEMIRSLVRSKAMQYASPYAADMQRLLADLEKAMTERQAFKEKRELMGSLQKIMEELRK